MLSPRSRTLPVMARISAALAHWRDLLPLLFIGAGALVVTLLLFGAVATANATSPARWTIDLPRGPDGVEAGGAITVRPPGWLARIEQVALYERRDGAEQAVPLATVASSGGTLQRSDGRPLLEPDRSYRLVLQGTVLPFGLPWTSPATVVRELSFSTEASPRPQLPAAPVTLAYGQDLIVEWNQPVENLAYEITPAADLSLRADPADPRRVHVTLQRYQDGTRYLLTFTGATGANGVSLQQPYRLEFVTPTFPRVQFEQDQVVAVGQPLLVRWNVPVRSFQAAAPDGVRVSTSVDERQPTLGLIKLEGLAQGKEHVLRITAAQGADGAPLAEPQELRFRTPPALQVAEFGPANGATRVRPGVHPYVTFSEPVADRAAAERAFRVEPAVAGRFEWESPTTMVFWPDHDFDFESQVSVRLVGGPESVRGSAGGFLDQDLAFSFTIDRRRVIDINLTEQVLRLIEGDEVVFSTLVATGVRGAETPTGTFKVEYKMPSTRMRGVNPSGLRYDIPDVPWVMPFFEDYAIHGAYWRSTFGRVGSNGCVSMPVPASKVVYDWADVGTPVVIHY